MNLVFHHLKKDCQRFKWLIAVWLILGVFQTVLYGWPFSTREPDSFEYVVYLNEFLKAFIRGMQYLLLFILIPEWIQEEPQTGTTGFWQTRPIPPRLLIQSKILFALLILILPPLIFESLSLHFSFINSQLIAWAAPEIILKYLTVVLSLACLAVLTTHYYHFVKTLLILLMIYLGIFFLLVAVYWYWPSVKLSYFLSQFIFPASFPAHHGISMACKFLALLFPVLILINQYFTHRLKISFLILSLGFLFTFSLKFAGVIKTPEEIPQDQTHDFSKVSIEIKPASIHPILNKALASKITYNGNVLVSGLPQHIFPRIHFTNYELKGNDFETKGSLRRSLEKADANLPNGIFHHFKGYHFINFDPDNDLTRYNLFQTKIDSAEFLSKQEIEYSGTCQVQLYQYDIVDEAPLLKGKRIPSQTNQILFQDMVPHEESPVSGVHSIDLNFIGQYLQLFFKPNDHPFFFMDPAFEYLHWKGSFYLLLNQKRREIYLPETNLRLKAFDKILPQFLLSRCPIQFRIKSNGFRESSTESSHPINREWLEESVLCLIEAKQVGELTRQVKCRISLASETTNPPISIP